MLTALRGTTEIQRVLLGFFYSLFSGVCWEEDEDTDITLGGIVTLAPAPGMDEGLRSPCQ